jgi:hypothetical protein
LYSPALVSPARRSLLVTPTHGKRKELRVAGGLRVRRGEGTTDPKPQVGMETLATKDRRNRPMCPEGDRGGCSEARVGLSYLVISLCPPALLPVGAEATGLRNNRLPPPPPAQSPPVGPRHRAGTLDWTRALSSSFPSPGRRGTGETPRPLSGSNSFQDELLAKRFEIPGRSLPRGGSSYLAGTQELRQSCQEKQLERRQRRHHFSPACRCASTLARGPPCLSTHAPLRPRARAPT